LWLVLNVTLQRSKGGTKSGRSYEGGNLNVFNPSVVPLLIVTFQRSKLDSVKTGVGR
jgi:hypothetical protein